MSTQDDKAYLTHEEYGSEAGLNTRSSIQDRFGTMQVAWFHWVFEHLQLPPSAHILDIGCGSGQMWWQNWHRMPGDSSLVLSDLSLAMAAAARARLPDYPQNIRVAFQVADGEALPFANAQFDAVFALGVLDHMPHRDACLAEVRRVLRPNGQFYASAGGTHHLQEMRDLVKPFLPDEHYGGDPTRFGLENGARELSNWFSVVRQFEYKDMLVFHEPNPIIDYIRSEGTVAKKLNHLQLAALVDHLRQELAINGVIHVTREKGLFIAGGSVNSG